MTWNDFRFSSQRYWAHAYRTARSVSFNCIELPENWQNYSQLPFRCADTQRVLFSLNTLYYFWFLCVDFLFCGTVVDRQWTILGLCVVGMWEHPANSETALSTRLQRALTKKRLVVLWKEPFLSLWGVPPARICRLHSWGHRSSSIIEFTVSLVKTSCSLLHDANSPLSAAATFIIEMILYPEDGGKRSLRNVKYLRICTT